MKTINGDLILTENTEFKESIKVNGNIKGKDNQRFDLKVNGNIDAGDINAMDINAWNINAMDIDARNIDAWDINARNIDAWDIDARNIDAVDIDAVDINAWNIVCDKRIKKSENSKTRARIFIENKLKLERKEW